MPQTVSKSKTKSSSNSKRHFTVVIGTKEHWLYCSSSPSSAARKAVSKLCGKEKGKLIEFCIREITQGSKKKTYGPYLGHIEKLAKPIQLKGRLVERNPVALLKPKRSEKKGGMRGGEEWIEYITISLGNCGRSRRVGFWKNGCITLIHNNKKVVLYYNEEKNEIEIRLFNNLRKNVYDNKYFIELNNFTIKDVNNIILYFVGSDIRTDEEISHSNKIKKKCEILLNNNITNDNKIKIILKDGDGDSIKLINKIIEFVNKSTDNSQNYIKIIDELKKILEISQTKYNNKLTSAIQLCKSLSLNLNNQN